MVFGQIWPKFTHSWFFETYVRIRLRVNAYHPFGMVTPGRSFSAGNQYRYGFNGKENDKDISDGAQDYGMRVYDGRLGKFLSVDPLALSYPMLTPYQFASNSPISGIDLDGLEFQIYYTKSTTENGQTRLSLGTHAYTTEAIIQAGLEIHHDFNLIFLKIPLPSSHVPLNVTYSTLGISPVAVDHGGQWLVLPDGVDHQNLPPSSDPVWNSFETLETFESRIQKKVDHFIEGHYSNDGEFGAWTDLINFIKSGDGAINLKTTLVNNKGNNVSIYRGGGDMKLKKGEYKVSDKAQIPVRGLSLTVDKNKADGFGGSFRILSIPSELKMIATPSKNDPGHFDIIPIDDKMSEEKYQNLLYQIKTEKIN